MTLKEKIEALPYMLYGSNSQWLERADVLAVFDQALAEAAPSPETCDQDCMACSGEVCMKHQDLCECDVVERHEDGSGNTFIGKPEGMRRRREAAPSPHVETIHVANKLVDGYDAQFWHDSYVLLRDAVVEHLDDCIRDDDVAEEAILVEAIETAGKRLNAEAAPSGWQPIETAPKEDGEDVIIVDGNGLVGQGFFDRLNQVWRWLDDDPVVPQPTHWQPLPPPPASGAKL